MPNGVTIDKDWWGEEVQSFKHDGLTYEVRVARKEVSHPLPGFGIVWTLLTRVRWQFFGEKEWTLEIHRSHPRTAGGHRIAVEHFPTRRAAKERADVIVTQRLVPLVDWAQLPRLPRPAPRPPRSQGA